MKMTPFLYDRESRLDNTAEVIKGLERELALPGSAPLHSMYVTKQQTSETSDSNTSNRY